MPQVGGIAREGHPESCSTWKVRVSSPGLLRSFLVQERRTLPSGGPLSPVAAQLHIIAALSRVLDPELHRGPTTGLGCLPCQQPIEGSAAAGPTLQKAPSDATTGCRSSGGSQHSVSVLSSR